MKTLKAAICGCGKMGRIIIQYLEKSGVDISAVFDHNEKVGLDVGEHYGMPKMGITIRDINTLVTFLSENKIDICIVATKSLLKDVYDIFYTCAYSGVNVISICEEAFYPQNSSPELISHLDRIAKENHCTLCGTGYQDVAWGYLITTLAGSLFDIGKITGRSSYNIEDYGMALAQAHGAGLSQQEFENTLASNVSEEEQNQLISEGKFKPSYRWNTNGWIASKLGLIVTSQKQYNRPIIADSDLNSSTLGITIPKSDVIGMSSVVNTKTQEGIELEFECIGKVYTPGETDEYNISIYDKNGKELISITIPEPQTVERTCATTVNRIPDVIKAPAGYITTDHLGPPEYRVNPLSSYLS